MFTKTALLALVASAAGVLGQDCDCYLSDGPAPTYFRNFGFWDFRWLSQHARVPPVINTVQGNIDADFTSPVFNWESQFQQFWGPQRWSNGNPNLPMVNTFNNLYIERNGNSGQSYLTMRTSRLSNFQTASEFESRQSYQHASVRMMSRTHGSPGACTSVFTFLGNDNPRLVQESDIEILTKDPANKVQYTNQPGYLADVGSVNGAHHNLTLPGGKRWTDFIEHRLDWTPGRTTWMADGTTMHSQTFQAPKDPSRIVFNAWSNGDSWSGAMSQGGHAYQNIQWIEMLYNSVPRSSCQRVCSIDRSAEPGRPIRI